MTLLAVDLAAKYSAACLMNSDGDVLDEWDSWQVTESQFVASLLHPFVVPPKPAVLIIEDLPHRVPFMSTTKRVCRLQGRIYERFDNLDKSELVLFVDPSTWRATYPKLKVRGSGPDMVVEVAADMGYTPPDFTERAKGNGGKTLAKKVATDYCAAFLIAHWALRTHRKWDSYEVPGTSRYGQQQIKKHNPGDACA